MTQSVSTRAASLAASAAMLGAGALVALTVTYELPRTTDPIMEPPTINTAIEQPLPPPEPTMRTQTLRLSPADRAPFMDPIVADAEAPEIVDTPRAYVGPTDVQTVTSPHWLRTPRKIALQVARRALERGVNGDVVLDCRVLTSGFLQCGVVSETPAGFGFANAALRIAADHQMRPAMRNGAAVEGRYRMRIPFRVD